MQCPYCKEEIMDGALKCKHCGSNLGQASQAVAPQAPDFGALFGATLNIWKNNLGDLAILTLVFLLVCWVPVANIGFIAGYTRSLFKVTRGQGRAQVGDIFNAWDCFGNLLVYLLLFLVATIVLHFVPFVGPLASVVLGFLIVPGIYAVIDNGQGAVDAFKWGIATIQADFVNWFLAYIVGNVIIFAGFIVLIVGVIVSASLGQMLIIQQYERCKPA